MIDLHTHTRYSDGTWSVRELLIKAQNTGVTVLSITDHNTVKAHIELQNMNVKDLYKGKVISGLEIDTVFDGVRIELLGYDFDVIKMQNWLDEYYNKDIFEKDYLNEYEEIANLCKINNIKMDNIEYRFSNGYPISTIHKNIIKYPENKIFFSDEEWNSADSFFRSCTCNKQFLLYYNFSDKLPNIEEVVKQIRKLNGKVFIAHLYLYELDNHIQFIKKLVDSNLIDGVEVYYSTFTNQQIKKIEEFCKDHDLLMSAGSDCHGEKKASRKIGIGFDNMNVQENVINNWIN